MSKSKRYGLVNTAVLNRDSALQQAWHIDISTLVPQRYAAYRPLVTDALLFFMQHLPPRRTSLILAEQQKMPSDTSTSQRFAALLHHCPTLHKLGQVLARDRRLSLEFRHRLQTLESIESKRLPSTLSEIIQRELRDFPLSDIQVNAKALAEASVAIVIPFTLTSPRAAEPTEGVLKVLKPGVEEQLEEELDIWSNLSVFIDERCEYYGIPKLHYADTLKTLRELLTNEIRLDREQRQLAQAADFYADSQAVQIPSLLPFCTPRITAMERVYGSKVTQTQGVSKSVRHRLADTIIKALIARPIWSVHELSLFHADPHAGNLFYTDDKRLAILDWSLVGHLGKNERVQTTQLMLGALTLDAKRIARAIEALGQTTPNESALRTEVEHALGQLYEGKLPGFCWLMDLLDRVMLSTGMRFGKDLLLFRKSVLTLEGVVADVFEEGAFDAALAAVAIRQVSKEWPTRALALPTSRAFGTHLSNLDLLSLYWEVPATASRFWGYVWKKWLVGTDRKS